MSRAWERAPTPRALPVLCGLTGRLADLHSAEGGCCSRGVHFLHTVPWAASPKDRDLVSHACTPLVPTCQGPSEDLWHRPHTAQMLGSPAATVGLLQVTGLSSPHRGSATSGKPISSCSPLPALKTPHPKGIRLPSPRSPSNSHPGGLEGRDPGWESGPCQERWGQG